MKKRISVAIATCRGERYISEQLDSLLGQTLPPDEIILCDDSPDELTRRAIEPYRERYPQLIRYFKNAYPLGVSANFERAISMTTGDIIFLCDQDDRWLPEKIERLASEIDDTNGGAFCDSLLVDAQLQPLGRTHRQTRGYSAKEQEILRHGTRNERERLCLKRFPGAGHNLAFSAKLKELILPFPNLPECHDSWIGYVVLLFSKWAFEEEVLTLFRQHDDNLSQTGRRSCWQEAIHALQHDSSGWYARLFQELLRRAQQTGRKLDNGLLQQIEARRQHSQIRSDMGRCSLPVRLPLIAGEFFSGRYFRFGRGMRSLFQDLVLRCFVERRV